MCVYIYIYEKTLNEKGRCSSVYVRFVLNRTLLVSWLPLGTMLRVSELSLTVSLLLRVRCHRSNVTIPSLCDGLSSFTKCNCTG